MTRPAQHTPLLDSIFSPGSLGDFLVRGEHGWPAAFDAQVEGARVRVSRSHVRMERQQRSARMGGGTVHYVRIGLEVSVTRDGETSATRCVEEMFSADHLHVLDLPLDDQAPERVARALHDTLRALHAEAPVDNLLTCCMAPMKLFEPLLDALLPAPSRACVDRLLGAEFHEALEERGGVVLEDTVGDVVARMVFERPQTYTGFRYHGQVRGRASVSLQCRHTGERLGCWRSTTPMIRMDARAHRLNDSLPREVLDQSWQSWSEELRGALGEELDGAPDEASTPKLDPDRLLSRCSFWDHLLRELC